MAQRNELIDKAEDIADQVMYFMLLFTPFVSKPTKINCRTCIQVIIGDEINICN